MELNKSQIAAKHHGDGPMVVIAGPGSGKTTVLTNRIQNLIEEHGARPDSILVITFTKAAADEMKARFLRLTGGKYKQVTFGTFHAVFFMILKNAYNYSVDSIIKDDIRRSIIRDAIIKSNAQVENMSETVENVSAEISRIKGDGASIGEYHAKSMDDGHFRFVYKYYASHLKNMGLIDFEDMLTLTAELFAMRKDILKKWQDRYKYILVDEFQDTNAVQYEVLKALAMPENNLFVVGDVDQSIYGFRGSRPEIMLHFKDDYPDAKEVLLDVNYRSTGNIVEAAGRVIRHNTSRFANDIRTCNESGDSVDIREFEDAAAQYETLAAMLQPGTGSQAAGSPFVKLQAGDQRPSCVILYRTNSVSIPLIRSLMERGIPFVMKDSVPCVFDHWIMRDIEAYIRVIQGSRVRADLLQIINKPKRYISRDYLTGSTIDLAEMEREAEEQPWVLERIEQMRRDLNAMVDMTPYAMINYLRRGVGYDEYLAEYAKVRDMELSELIMIADEIMESARTHKTFAHWRDAIDEYRKVLKEKHSAQVVGSPGSGGIGAENAAVTLMTMHGAKGLEFDEVYIVDACESIIPHKKSVHEKEIEEERRIFYVAMTRARRVKC